MKLTRTPPVFTIDLTGVETHGDLLAECSVLSDGTLLVLVAIGREWRARHRTTWPTEINRRFTEIFAHVTTHRVCFGLVIHVRPDADLSFDIIRHVNELIKSRQDILNHHLKGTVVVVPSKAVEVIIWAALALQPPQRPFETYVVGASDTKAAMTKWGLPRDVQKSMCKKVAAMPWPDT